MKKAPSSQDIPNCSKLQAARHKHHPNCCLLANLRDVVLQVVPWNLQKYLQGDA